MTDTQIRVVELEDHPAGLLANKNASLLGSQKSFLDYGKILFLLVFFMPSLVIMGYYWFFASDTFVSESKFVVRSSSGTSSIGLPGVADGMGLGAQNSDTSIVNTYLLSPDALNSLRLATSYDANYSSPNVDPLSRFPGWLWKENTEDRLKFYQTLLDVRFDKTSQITTLSVRAFEPNTAQAMSRHLLKAAEELVNKLSVRMRQDMISQAERDVLLALQDMTASQKDTERWRKENKMIDPISYSKGISEVIVKLALELSSLKASVQEKKIAAPNNPQIQQTNLRIAALKAQIDSEWSRLAGDGNSISAALSEYEQLTVEALVAQKVYGLAKASLVSARSEANQRESYLVTITEPNLPTYPLLPKRILNTIYWWAGLFFAYLIALKIVGNIVRHGKVRRHAKLGASLVAK
jgi:capsular polysaccharide transport system permease protein